MRVLLIRNKDKYATIENAVIPVLQSCVDTVEISDRVDVFDEEYMSDIINIVNDNRIDILFSVGYIEQYSLLCGVLKLEYIAWISDNDNGSAYSYTIRNEWNHIYTANKVLMSRLSGLGIENMRFLPLCYASSISDASDDSNNAGNVQEDIVLWTDAVRSDISMNTAVNALKDSTKGYLDAYIKARRADINLESVYSALPEYIAGDIKDTIEFEQSSFFGFADYCDYCVFYPILDKTVAYIYFHMLISNKVVDRVSFAMEDILPYTNKELVRIEKSEIVDGEYKELDKYKIVVYFPKFVDEGIIPEDLWNIMMRGSFVLCAANIDLSPLGNDAPETFKNVRELEMKARYYLDNDEERKKRAMAVRTKVRELGSYEKRIADIIDSYSVTEAGNGE